ncbi:LexA family transcriptional regulator [Streptococcus constellatus]|uniref:LexA family transcriptional regulator n=1 Tax=Streptococcus constellatus TaxID=76860 RepID=UPI002000DC1E|nr:XRE family transcriptional regulator [Streptococcus constellatus]
MARGRGKLTPQDYEYMKIVSNNINYLLETHNKKQIDIVRFTGIPASTLTGYVKGTSLPIPGNVQKIADFFGVKKSQIDPRFKSPNTSNELVQAINDTVVQLTKPNQKIVLRTSEELLATQENELNEESLYEYHVFEKLSAGNGYDYLEDRNYDVVFFNKDIDHDFASWVYGDSMEPKYLDGSVALIKDTGFDYDGAIYAVDWDGQSYIKKVYKEKDGLRLVSINDKYDDKFAKWEEEPRIIGKVVGNFMPVER